jgi:hypothetical protein
MDRLSDGYMPWHEGGGGERKRRIMVHKEGEHPDMEDICIPLLSYLDIPMSVRGARRSWGGTIMAQDEAY